MTDASAEVGPGAPPPVVDTPQHRDELECPLCGYSLRGLTARPASNDQPDAEPTGPRKARCPECGYPFWWEQLLRARQHRHPYLFEHHAGVRGFFRTLFGGLRPRRFWSSVNAGHQLRVPHLLFYGLVVTLLAAASVPAGYFLGMAVTLARREMRVRTQFDAVDLLLDPGFWQESLDETRAEVDLITCLTLSCAAWPWITLAALLVFQTSMRRAHVRAAHVVRCVVYSGDVLVWSGLGLVAGGALGVLSLYQYVGAAGPIVDCILPAVLLAACRLGVAYRRYLRFDHAWSTALSSQVIYLLAITTLLVLLYEDFFRLLW